MLSQYPIAVRLFLTFGIAAFTEAFVSVQWAAPYCNNQTDGPAYYAIGVPLPYMLYSGVSSLENLFMPHVYLLNLFFLSALIFIAVHFMVGWLTSVHHRFPAFLGITGFGLCSVAALAVIWQVQVGILQPVLTIGSNYAQYSQYRPVGVSFGVSRTRDCLPSTFWFSNG